jgi:clan AA aspartic protease
MGSVEVLISIAHPTDWSRSVTFEKVLIDTGATIASVPRDLANDLELPVFARRRARTIEGPQDLDVAYAMLTIGGERTLQEVFVSDTYDKPLIGVIPLESLGFAVDPVNNRLVPVELLLL